MAWSMRGRWLGLCSCSPACRCLFGVGQPEGGWCAGGLILEVRRGYSDGVSLNGARMAWIGDWPSGFTLGRGTARLYVDEDVSADQHRELEAIGRGQRGGAFAALAAAVACWLPTQAARVEMHWDDGPSARVGSIGRVQLQPPDDSVGTGLEMTPGWVVAAAGVERYRQARSDGSEWNDPDRPHWRAAGNGGVADFTWCG